MALERTIVYVGGPIITPEEARIAKRRREELVLFYKTFGIDLKIAPCYRQIDGMAIESLDHYAQFIQSYVAGILISNMASPIGVIGYFSGGLLVDWVLQQMKRVGYDTDLIKPAFIEVPHKGLPADIAKAIGASECAMTTSMEPGSKFMTSLVDFNHRFPPLKFSGSTGRENSLLFMNTVKGPIHALHWIGLSEIQFHPWVHETIASSLFK